MGLFDQIWHYNDGFLIRYDGKKTIPCPDGMVARRDVDEVMDPLGFDREESNPSTLVYRDRQPDRRLDPQVRLGFPFPPSAIHYGRIKYGMDLWEAGPADDIDWK